MFSGVPLMAASPWCSPHSCLVHEQEVGLDGNGSHSILPLHEENMSFYVSLPVEFILLVQQISITLNVKHLAWCLEGNVVFFTCHFSFYVFHF